MLLVGQSGYFSSCIQDQILSTDRSQDLLPRSFPGGDVLFDGLAQHDLAGLDAGSSHRCEDVELPGLNGLSFPEGCYGIGDQTGPWNEWHLLPVKWGVLLLQIGRKR